MKIKTVLMVFILCIKAFFILGQEPSLNMEYMQLYWSRDSLIEHMDLRSEYIESFDYKVTLMTDEKIIIEEHHPEFNTETMFYFRNDSLVKIHYDFYGDHLEKAPLKEYLDYVYSIDMVQNTGYGFEMYLRTKDKTYKSFEYNDVPAFIKNNGAKLHAVKKYHGDFYEVVLLTLGGKFHLNLICETDHFEPYAMK